MALAVGGPPKLNRCRARPTVLNASAPHLTPANNQGTSSMSPGSRLRLLTSLPCFSTKAWFHHPSRVGPILWSKKPFSPAQQAGPARYAPKKILPAPGSVPSQGQALWVASPALAGNRNRGLKEGVSRTGKQDVQRFLRRKNDGFNLHSTQRLVHGSD